MRPITDAGIDQSITSNEFVRLDGSSNSDPNESVLRYSWKQT
jgi:hypothetical protein